MNRPGGNVVDDVVFLSVIFNDAINCCCVQEMRDLDENWLGLCFVVFHSAAGASSIRQFGGQKPDEEATHPSSRMAGGWA
jgi:hypothetical protein